MDFDTAKENIQPLRQGRRADRLEMALGEQNKESLEAEKKQYEETISKYEGRDPLAPWYDYICWIEQSFPKSGTESGLDEAVLKCIVHFEDDTRYKQDRRMIKLYIKFIDTQENPNECYSQLYNNGIGTLVADLYVAWSYYFDALNDFKQVEAIFRKGFDAGAQPFEDLAQAHQAFGLSMSRRMLYDDEGSKKQFQATMEEKRSALTSLRAHKKKFVGSVRTGIAVRDENPGIVNQENVPASSNLRHEVHEDEQAEAVALPANTSVIRSIIDSARKKENVHEPGPWSKAKLGKTGRLFGRTATSAQPGFSIMEDADLPPISCSEKLFEKGIQLPTNWFSSNQFQKPWNIPMVVEEPVVPRSVPQYEKFLLYPDHKTEISPDEYRAYKWFKDHNMTSPLIEMYESVWSNTYETGVRIPPGFVNRNVVQIEKNDIKPFIHDELFEGCKFVVALEKMYPGNDEVTSLEELKAEKFNRGEIKILTEEDFEEFNLGDDMDLTVVGDRRQSIYPAWRKSIVPRKSLMARKSVMMPPPPLEEEPEDEPEEVPVKVTQSRVRFEAPQEPEKSIFKRKFEEVGQVKADDSMTASSPKKEFVAETPPRVAFNVFKPPAPVEKKQIRPFEIHFEEEDANDTCSTQQFNFFIKAQSVSTPVGKKAVPKLVAMAAPVEIASPPEEDFQSDVSPTNRDSVLAPACTTQGQPKQLSIIMETTEQSTKSSTSHASSGNDTDMHTKTPKHYQNFPQFTVTQQEVEKRLHNPMLASFRIPEDQTTTCGKIVLPILSIPVLEANATMPKINIAPPAFEIFEDEPAITVPYSFKSSYENTISLPDETTGFEIPPTQIKADKTKSFEMPQTQNQMTSFESPSMPSPPEEQKSFEVPATQSPPEIHDSFEIPATQSPPKAFESFEIPPTQSPPKAKHSFMISPSQNAPSIDVPASQDINDDFEIPATQDEPADDFIFEVPNATTQTAVVKLPEVSKKNDSFAFNIYEDSVKEVPQQKAAVVTAANFNLLDDEGTGFLHMSRKENLIVQPPISVVQRRASDEFLDLLTSPPKPKAMGKSLGTSRAVQNDVSDLLKFSGISQASVAGQLSTSLKNLSLELPKSATPTNTMLNLFDEDLNTEKFSMALGNFKNSTLLAEPSKATIEPMNDFDLSIAIGEDEMNRLGISAKQVVGAEFKVPQLPVPKAAILKPEPPAASIFGIYEDNDDAEENMSKSIYHPKPEVEAQLENDESWEDEMMCSFVSDPLNAYEHTFVEPEDDLSLKVREAIQLANGNPFGPELREMMLEHCNFSFYLAEHIKTCTLLKTIPKLRSGSVIDCGGETFNVQKFIAKGSYGFIFNAKSSVTGKVVAMKQEKPSNLWEYYINVELFDRLKNKKMSPAFMYIERAIIANNSSVFVTQFSHYGTLIDVCNKNKNFTHKNIDEYVVMVLTTQLLSIIDHLHGCKIIHADIKPDNFLLMSKIEFGMKVPAIQLIDFGSAIDMDFYEKGQKFTCVVETENFMCCEMQEGKPWTFQTDLFGIAGTAHVLLFGKYMEVEKGVLSWAIKSRFPRYFNKFLWEQFFNALLNVPNCDSMPNLQAIKDQFEEEIHYKEKYVCDKILEFNKAIGN